MMPDFRKLKRGLKDVSPLFEPDAEEPVLIKNGLEKTGLKVFSVFSPDHAVPSLALSQYLVSQLVAQNLGASVLSLGKKKEAPQAKKSFWHHFMNWEKFREICKSPVQPSGPLDFSHTLFLDFDDSNSEQFQEIVPMLDAWIFLVKPEMESLSESYRRMKASRAMNGRLEYFLLFQEVTDDPASRLFEKYGEFVDRRLGIDLSWLGTVETQNGRGFSARLALEALFLGTAGEMEALEKKALLKFLMPELDSRQAG